MSLFKKLKPFSNINPENKKKEKKMEAKVKRKHSVMKLKKITIKLLTGKFKENEEKHFLFYLPETLPPHTRMVCPLMPPAPFLTKNATVAAISSGNPPC